MEANILDFTLKSSETFHITPLPDIHDDSRACPVAKYRRFLDRRAALPNHYFLSTGDLSNYVMSGDKRYTPSVPVLDLADADAYIDAQIERQYQMYKGYKWLGIGIGNHELATWKYCKTNPGKRLADKLGVKYLGYSGFLRLRWWLGKRQNSRQADCQTTLLYHHGAWGGRLAKGYIGAKAWADCFEGWDMFVYGHCHKERHDPEAHAWLNDKGEIKNRRVYYINVGTFAYTLLQGRPDAALPELPMYSEVKGHTLSNIPPPLIKIKPVLTHGTSRVRISVEYGDV